MSNATIEGADLIEMLPVVEKLDKDTKAAAAKLTEKEARFLVDTYYQFQEERKRADNQILSMSASLEPHAVIDWTAKQFRLLETRVASLLDVYSDSRLIGQWARSIVGIGPIIAAGLMAHIDISKAPTAGHIHRFAGLDPTVKWLGREGAKSLMGDVLGNVDLVSMPEDDSGEPDPHALSPEQLVEYQQIVSVSNSKGELNTRQLLAISKMTNRKFGNILRLARDDKGRITQASMTAMLAKRPWNAALKTLQWKASESFVKVSGREGDVYGQVYLVRKAYEEEKNIKGDYADQAAIGAARVGRKTEAYQHYSQGRLPPGHLHARAKRYASKLFLSHYHEVDYFTTYNKLPPLPYPIVHLGHGHVFRPPNLHLIPGLEEAKTAQGPSESLPQL